MKTAEQKFIELFQQYRVTMFYTRFPNYICEKTNNQWLFWYRKTTYTTFVNKKVFHIFEDDYNMKYTEMIQFINDMLLKYFNIKDTEIIYRK